jgi:hypothetical protein
VEHVTTGCSCRLISEIMNGVIIAARLSSESKAKRNRAVYAKQNVVVDATTSSAKIIWCSRSKTELPGFELQELDSDADENDTGDEMTSCSVKASPTA